MSSSNLKSQHSSPTKSPSYINSTSANASSNCSLAMRVQKKVLSKLSKRGVVRLFANDQVCALMDTLYAILKLHYDQQTAEKVVKNVIKLTFKLGAMERENSLNEVQRQLMAKVERELGQLALTIQSFQALLYSYNQQFLLNQLLGLRHSTHSLVHAVLSEKSGRRVDSIFEQLTNDSFLRRLASTFPGYEETEESDEFTRLVRKFNDHLGELMLCTPGYESAIDEEKNTGTG